MGEIKSLKAILVLAYRNRLSIAYLVLGQLRLDCWPCLTLSSITKQIHDNCASRYSLIHLEKICSRNPAILLSFIP